MGLALLVLLASVPACRSTETMASAWSSLLQDAEAGSWDRVHELLPRFKHAVSSLPAADQGQIMPAVEKMERMMLCAQAANQGSALCQGLRHLDAGEWGEGIASLFASLAKEQLSPQLRNQVERLIPSSYYSAASESADSNIKPMDKSRVLLAVKNATQPGSFRSDRGIGPSFKHHLYPSRCPDPSSEPDHHMAKLHGALGHWPELVSRRPSSSYLHLTSVAQSFIWKHQQISTSTCSSPETKFLVARLGPAHGVGAGSGIGCVLHMVTESLALAIQLGRVLVLDPADKNLFATDPSDDDDDNVTSSRVKFCGAITSLECFFLPLSSCSIEDALLHETQPANMKWWSHDSASDLVADRVIQTVGNPWPRPPDQFRTLLEGQINEAQRLWWWNAQAIGYIVRPNQKTRLELAQRRKRYGLPTTRLPPGTISTHVRHGDKGIEAQLVRFDDYMLAAQILKEQGDPQLAQRVFVSTEDPSVLESSRKWNTTDWRIMYANLERANLPVFGLIQKFGGVEEMLNSLLNLQLAVECDAWICTLSSNWCRLIDELRSVVAGKANSAYVDIGFRCFQGCKL